LVQHGILVEATGQRRNRVYLARGILDALGDVRETSSPPPAREPSQRTTVQDDGSA
jgi:hypothetical protein